MVEWVGLRSFEFVFGLDEAPALVAHVEMDYGAADDILQAF